MRRVLDSIIQGDAPPVHARPLAGVRGHRGHVQMRRGSSARAPGRPLFMGRSSWAALRRPLFMGRDEFLVAVRSYLPNAQDCRWHRVEMRKALMAAVCPGRPGWRVRFVADKDASGCRAARRSGQRARPSRLVGQPGWPAGRGQPAWPAGDLCVRRHRRAAGKFVGRGRLMGWRPGVRRMWWQGSIQTQQFSWKV